jgi:hypothetical protein
LPKEILAPLECKEEDKLMVFSSRSAIVIKRIGAASLPERFDKLADEIEAPFRKRGVAERMCKRP